ncbi:MAG: tetratricopeptide repeat protein [Elusimicrobiota bacterium]|nr:tetratricopeptide repeat protein [Elusimicrobiota bacterium]
MKYLLTPLFLLHLSCFAFAQNACLERAREFFGNKDYASSEQVLAQCLKQNPKDAQAQTSLAGAYLAQGKTKEAQAAFLRALQITPPNAFYAPYINSRLGDIYLRQNDLQRAAGHYDAALKQNPADVNALIGKGLTEESAGRKLNAAQYYKNALALDFVNMAARRRLIALEPDILTEREIFETLKERNIIDTFAASFSPMDLNTLKKILSVERDNGIGYLSSRYNGRIPSGFVVERDLGKIYVRLMLTLPGYNALISQFSSDAKTFFLNQDIFAADIFKLRDLDGKDIFDEEGRLTTEGLRAYSRAATGVKSYILPHEVLPSAQAQIDNLAAQYIKEGYAEISEAELAYVRRESLCSEQTLISIRMKIINISAARRRIFVPARPDDSPPFSIPYEMVVDLRRSYKENKAPVYANTFGVDSRQAPKLCGKDGVLASAFKTSKLTPKP